MKDRGLKTLALVFTFLLVLNVFSWRGRDENPLAMICLAEAAVSRNGPLVKALDHYYWHLGRYPTTQGRPREPDRDRARR